MQVFETNYHAARGAPALLPRELENDPSIWFHGTTSVSEEAIDTDGFSGRIHPTIRQDVEAMVKVFKSMNWLGGETGAVSNLTAYSLPRMNPEGRTGTYFRESPFRCVAYTGQAWSGGETIWSLGECFNYLRQYLADEQIREEHLAEQITSFKEAYEEDSWEKPPVIRVDLDWLRRQLEILEPVVKRCCASSIERTHGVIYAVQMTPEDFPWLDHGHAPGLSCRKALGPDRIIAKLRLHGEYVDFDLPLGLPDKREFLSPFWQWRNANPSPPSKGRCEWEAAERDPAAGEDISAGLAAERHTTA